MTSADAVRRVGLALPRVYEREVRGRWKLKVGQLVFVAFSRDETEMGFGYPRAERDGLVASDPDTFHLPGAADLRYQWVCARLDRLGDEEMRELVTDAWRMCTPRMLHDLPELPAPAMRLWDLVERRAWDDVRRLLHPSVRLDDGSVSVRGRTSVMDHWMGRPTPRPPTEVEVRDGRVYRWSRRV
jgi:hypothetical protein